jgi:hypothetical protein
MLPPKPWLRSSRAVGVRNQAAAIVIVGAGARLGELRAAVHGHAEACTVMLPLAPLASLKRPLQSRLGRQARSHS